MGLGKWRKKNEGRRGDITLGLLVVSTVDMVPGVKMFLFFCAAFVFMSKKKRRLEPFSAVSETKCTQ